MKKAKLSPIFLSYSHQDRTVVEAKIIRNLEKCRVWWDGGGDDAMPAHEGIDIGGNFPEEIRQAIRDCRIFLFALSRNSLHSGWCKFELSLASRCGKTILPILIEPNAIAEGDREIILTDIRARLPPEIHDIQWLDLSGTITGREKLLPNWLQQHGLCRRGLSHKLMMWLMLAFGIGVLAGLNIPVAVRAMTPPAPVEPMLRSLVDRELAAVLAGDGEEIQRIYIEDAIVEDADPNGRIWYDATAYYGQNRANIFYCRAEHSDFEVVVLTDNYARATTGSAGAFGFRSQNSDTDCPNRYSNPRGADIWEFVRDESGEWRISRFTFNAHRK